ncbi:cyclase [Halobacteriales archaeon QS_8_69_26]|nr:MAG: cyclase [Halobacteriales archaeon QS_8_69_26]
MPSIELTTVIDAPVERVFDAARDVDRHAETMADHGERAVAGVTEGRLAADDTVTWRSRHFGVPLELTVRTTEMDRPQFFRDEQVDGPFREMRHDHRFERLGPGRTKTVDDFRFASPLGPVGSVVDALVLERYMRRLLSKRNRALRDAVE